MYCGPVMGIAFLLVAMGASLTILPCDAAKRRFTVADDIGLAHFGDIYTGKADAVTFSPDALYFVVDTERGLLEQDLAESTLRVYCTKDVHEFLLGPKTTPAPSPIWTYSVSTYKDGPIVTRIRWLPDSSGISFLAKTAAGNDQLFLGDLKTKSVYALTPKNQSVRAFDIRDREHFVYSVQSSSIREEAIRENEPTSIVGTGRFLGGLMFPMDSSYLAVAYDLAELWAGMNGKRFRVSSESSAGPIYLHAAAESVLVLSPDCRFVMTLMAASSIPQVWETLYPPSLASDPSRIRAGRQDLEALDGHEYVSEYVVIELSTGKVKSLTNAPIGQNIGWWSGVPSANWSPDGQSVVVSGTFVAPKTSETDQQLNRPCVAVVDLAKGEVACIKRLKGKAKTKSGYEDGYHSIQSVRFSRGSSRELTVDYWEMAHSGGLPGDWSKRSTTYMRSDAGMWRVVATADGWKEQNRSIELNVNESFTDPPVLIATDETTKDSRIIFDPNPQLKDIDLGEASVYRWKDKNGRDWVGGLYKPSDYVESKRYPLVVQTHGFFETIFRPSGIYPTAFAARELAAAEILVLQVPSCPYTVDSEEASCNIAGYEAGVERLIADGLVDPDSVGIVGFSRTCYYVLKALTMSARHFKAASITAGSNFGYLEYMNFVDIRGNVVAREAQAMIGAPPFGRGLQQWLKVSPTFNMEKVTIPLQVVALGRPSLLDTWEPYATLRYLNKPVDLIVVREGTHVLTNPAERIISQGGTVDWFRFWLQGYEDSDPSKKDQYARWRELRKLQEANAAGQKPN